jgi:hypothetical protein
MGNAVECHKPSRMNIKSTHERIALFKLALDVNSHQRDEILNELMQNYVMETLHSDSTSIYPCDDVLSRVTQVFA